MMNQGSALSCIAFEGTQCIASGELKQVVTSVKKVLDRGPREPVLIFDASTSEMVEFDFRGTMQDVLKRLETVKLPTDSTETVEHSPRRPGRPRLGVVAREVTLLPRHWQWLNSQPGGASVALRKLVEEARRTNAGKDRVRIAQESAYKFMSAMAGNLPGFEEATRSLFAGNKPRFDELVQPWPIDIRNHAKTLAATAMGER